MKLNIHFHGIIYYNVIKILEVSLVSTKIIQITDLHLNKSRELLVNGVNTYDSANSVLNEIQNNEKDADCLILSGDLSNDCSSESYEHLMVLLKSIKLPIYLMSGNHDSPSLLRKISNSNNVHFKSFNAFQNWGVFMFNTKKHNSPNGILNQNELLYFDKILKDKFYKNIIIFLHHHPVLIGSASMDKMVIENADLLISRIKKSNKVRAVCWGHVHTEYYQTIGSVELFSTPSTCYQAKEKSKDFIIDNKASPGYRKIKLNADGSINTEVVRI